MNMNSDIDAQDRLSIIAIGASAGGLESVSELLSHLDAKFSHAIVILQHLSPNYKSMMAELLTRETRLRVVEMENNTVPKAGIVYVVPPNKNAYVKDDIFYLHNALPEISPKPSINEFFLSLSAELRERAVGVVLSGTGSDGTAGLRAIQESGGISIVQQPESAKYSGMPLSAIESGYADFVLPPKQIAKKLMELPSNMLTDLDVSTSTLENVLSLLQQKNNLDFSGYKVGTLSRRVRRRMVATGHTTIDRKSVV